MAPREIVVETAVSAEEIEQALTLALADGKVFALIADKGGKVLIPADKIAYIELDLAEPRRIGFGSSSPGS